MPSRGACGLLTLFAAIAALLQLPTAHAIDAKCSACVAVATQLQSALEAERPRNHLDMRGRLDSKGVRYGKLIDYKVSELRFVELLETLCDDVGEKFGLDASLGAWTAGAKSAGKLAERKALRKELEGYCHRLVEAQEDALQEALYAGVLENESVEELMCRAYAPRDCEGEPDARNAERDGETVRSANGDL